MEHRESPPNEWNFPRHVVDSLEVIASSESSRLQRGWAYLRIAGAMLRNLFHNYDLRYALYLSRKGLDFKTCYGSTLMRQHFMNRVEMNIFIDMFILVDALKFSLLVNFFDLKPYSVIYALILVDCISAFLFLERQDSIPDESMLKIGNFLRNK